MHIYSNELNYSPKEKEYKAIINPTLKEDINSKTSNWRYFDY